MAEKITWRNIQPVYNLLVFKVAHIDDDFKKQRWSNMAGAFLKLYPQPFLIAALKDLDPSIFFGKQVTDAFPMLRIRFALQYLEWMSKRFKEEEKRTPDLIPEIRRKHQLEQPWIQDAIRRIQQIVMIFNGDLPRKKQDPANLTREMNLLISRLLNSGYSPDKLKEQIHGLKSTVN